MPTITVTEVYENREGAGELLGERSYKRCFKAETDAGTVGPEDVLVAPGVPQLGDVYVTLGGTYDHGCYCKRVSARQMPEHPRYWTIDAEYSSKVETGGGGGATGSSGGGGGGTGSGGGAGPGEAQVTNPTLRPPEVRFGTNKVRKVITKDKDGLAIRNSAGDAFDPPPEIEEVRLTMTVSRNEVNFVPVQKQAYVQAVNSVPWLGFPRRSVKCNGISGDLTFEQGISFWRVTYEFEVRDDSWDFEPLDAGYRRKDGGVLKQITLDGRMLTSPALLDGAGEVLAVGANPVFLTFFIYSELDFNELGLGTLPR